MLKKILGVCSLILLLVSCSNKSESFVNNIIGTQFLQEQQFTINTTVENRVKTKNGIEFLIPANAIKAKEVNVEIVVKEALTIEAMIKANLTTQTKDGLLSSDGMFLFSTKQKATIEKNIEVKVPTKNYNPNMQLFTGNNESGKIVWENPKPIMQNPAVPNGENLFVKNCASCHAINKQLTGPALAHVENRFNNRENLIEYIKNSSKFMQWHYDGVDSLPKGYTYKKLMQKKEDAAYTLYLHCMWNGSAMNSFEGILRDEEIVSILDYIKNESKKYPDDFNTKNNFLNCKQKFIELVNLVNMKEDLENRMPKRAMVELNNMQPTADTIGTISKVAIEKFEAQYYVFNIDAAGWYNIDELLRKENTAMSILTVEPNQDTLKRKEIFLAIPAYKVFAQGGLINKTQYSFYYTNSGELPLPQGAEAYAIVFGEINKQLYFGVTQFVTSRDQNIKVEIKISSKDEIEKSINTLKFQNFNLKVEKNEPKFQLDSLENLIQKKQNELKAKNCDCVLYSNAIPGALNVEWEDEASPVLITNSNIIDK